MDLAYAWLKKRYSESLAQALCVTNPQATLTGELFEPDYAEVASEPRKWYQLWR